MLHKLIVLSALQMLSLAAGASQILHLDVDREADTYEIRVVMEVDAPANNVRAILTDFANLDRLNASITTSRVIGAVRKGTVRVLTRMENCVLFFCLDMQKVEDVTQDERGRILVTIVPDSSNFRSGEASWEIQNTTRGSRVIHHASLEPDISIPPLVGPAVLKKALQREIRESFNNLGCLASLKCGHGDHHSTFDELDKLTLEM